MESKRTLRESRCPLKPRDGPLIDACLCPLGNLIFQVIEYQPTSLPASLPTHLTVPLCRFAGTSRSAAASNYRTWNSGRQAPSLLSPSQRSTCVPPGPRAARRLILVGPGCRWGSLMLISRDQVCSQRL